MKETHSMKHIPFFKMTGSGNDFIIIDNRSRLIETDRFRELARLACRRRLSVGADGLIFIEDDPEVDFVWRFFNADGSEAEMCGNGARCAARFAHLNGIARDRLITFRTLAGIIRAEIKWERVKVLMPRPQRLTMDITLQVEALSLPLDFIDTGVPHVVHFVPNQSALDSIDVFRLGRTLRHHLYFQPSGTNVDFGAVLDSHHMAVRTYERGVEAETLACGTGCIAAVLLASARNLVVSPVDVLTQSRETLTVHFERSSTRGVSEFSEVFLEGDARVVYEGRLWDETIRE